jgi:hypothetical protein
VGRSSREVHRCDDQLLHGADHDAQLTQAPWEVIDPRRIRRCCGPRQRHRQGGAHEGLAARVDAASRRAVPVLFGRVVQYERGEVRPAGNPQVGSRRRAPLWLSDASLKFGHPVKESAPLGPVLGPIWTTWSRSERVQVSWTDRRGRALLSFDMQVPDATRFCDYPDGARLGKDGVLLDGIRVLTRVRMPFGRDSPSCLVDGLLVVVQCDLEAELIGVVRPTPRATWRSSSRRARQRGRIDGGASRDRKPSA